MAEQRNSGPFWGAYQELKAGRLSRRQFIQRATALGVGLPVTTFILNSVNVGGVAAQGAAARPSAGTEGQQRGAGGELKLLQWQAATHASLHTSQGTKDILAASLVTEPLLNLTPDGTLIPTLAKEVPSVENGLLSEDLKTVTYNLLEGVLWSDGEPFTANDVVFTYQWVIEPANSATSIAVYQPIEVVEAVDDLTVKITFKEASLSWYNPFTGTAFGAVYPAHFWGGDPTNTDAINTFRQAPIGTGPYVVESFAENDQVIYAINENYREPNKPYFSRVNLKGGGDAAAAARAVLETGDWHMAWNLQVEPQVLAQMAEAGQGALVTVAGTSVERLLINFSDPNTEVNGQRSQKDTPHPFLSDLAVRQALAASCDRQTMSEQFYEGEPGEPPGVNILTGIPVLESPNTAWEFNVDTAKQILEDAGWVMDGDVRAKDGVELSVTYSTSINAVRQKEQAVNKQAWEEIGFKVQLKQVDAGIFFDSAAGNEQNASHFFNDVQMYTNNPATPYPASYMASWYGGPDGSNIAQMENDWSGLNESRWSNAEYDALYDSLLVETDAETAAESFIRMNDILINEVVVIPLVQRAAAKFAIANTLNPENIAASDWEVLYWNIANWNEVG
ncbi:MAG: peptide ABC transporter substrate-binding protein [Thermomicrobiales bacterium]